MDNLNNGGVSVLDLDSTASQLRKQDILARYEHMRKSVRESKALELNGETVAPFIVKLTSSTVPPGTPRMLTEVELDELRETKRQIAEYIKRGLEQGYYKQGG
jgi:hypothetical protein